MVYIQFDFTIKPIVPFRDILIARLSENGFDSFVNTDDGLQAFVPEGDLDEEHFKNIEELNSDLVDITFTRNTVEDQNWNQKWEEQFDPIYYKDEIIVRAPFHPKEDGFKFELIIQPQMSFGTGHHQTTYLMMGGMLEHEMANKTILDMGSGTGILAVLAEKLGAKHIDAVDIDEWAYNNAIENVELNHCEKIKVHLGDGSWIGNQKFDVVLANINRNILLGDMKAYAESLEADGLLFLSGFFDTDVEQLTAEALKNNLTPLKNYEREHWTSLVFAKKA